MRADLHRPIEPFEPCGRLRAQPESLDHRFQPDNSLHDNLPHISKTESALHRGILYTR